MRFLLSFYLLFILWFLLSGKTDLFHLSLGLISVLIITLWSGNTFIPDNKKSTATRFKEFAKFLPYSAWLLKEIVKSNIHVLKVCFHPNIHEVINPQLIRIKTNLKHDLPKFLYATSITLTPGTVTVKIEGDELLIHALTDETAQGCDGSMEKKVSDIFGTWA